MLTQHEVRTQLDSIANEVAQAPGLYYELYSRLFSDRVQRWINTAPQTEAMLIQRIAENDPDYLLLNGEALLAGETPVALENNSGLLFNPAWDIEY